MLGEQAVEQASGGRLGKYQLVAELARGGIGIVHLAVTTGRGRFTKRMVVKELKPSLSEDPAFTEMFMEEARLAARLEHPNIVHTYEAGQDGQRQYMVMEYLEGVTLAAVLKKKPIAFTLAMQLRTICEMLQGLEYAHRLSDFDGTPLGLVHRDVSPQNVLMTFDGQVKLLDFGIAKASDTEVATRIGAFKGKPAYMSPEQLEGNVDARADVFSAGVMIWDAVAGARMWGKKSNTEILTKLILREVPSLEAVAPNAPAELLRICNVATAPDREKRYASAAALGADLDAYLKANEDVTARDIGRTLSEAFESERGTTRLMIEMQLSRLKADPAPDPEASAPIKPSAPPSAAPPPPVPAKPAPESAVLTPARRRSLIALGSGSGVAVAIPLLFLLHRGPPRPAASTQTGSPSVVATAPARSTASAQATPPSTAPRATEAAPVAAAPPSTGSVAASAPDTAPTVMGFHAERPTPPAQTWAPRPAPAVVNWGAARHAGGAAESARIDASTGYLTIDTYPWSHVTLGSRVLGDTPIVHLPIAAGTYTLTFDNPDANVHKSAVVVVKAAETFTRKFEL